MIYSRFSDISVYVFWVRWIDGKSGPRYKFQKMLHPARCQRLAYTSHLPHTILATIITPRPQPTSPGKYTHTTANTAVDLLWLNQYRTNPNSYLETSLCEVPKEGCQLLFVLNFQYIINFLVN